MTLVAMIPARAGSKGLPGKNTRLLAGKPMIEWTIRAAQGAGLTAVVNSDCGESLYVAKHLGAERYERDPALATDNATMLDVVRDFAVNGVHKECTGLVVLYPTYPLRTSSDILSSLETFSVHGSNRPLVGAKLPGTHPYMCVTLERGRPQQLIPHDRNQNYRRQDLPQMWELTHCACILPIASVPLLDAQLMSPQSVCHVVTGPVIDVDTEADFRHAEALLRTRTRDRLSEQLRELLALERGWA